MIEKEVPGFELCKDVLVVPPTEHIVRGFLIEATTEKGRVYLWRVVTPLHRPMRHVFLNYSKRIPEQGPDIYIDPNAYKQSADVILGYMCEHTEYLRTIRTPVDFLQHISWMMGNDSMHFRFDLALTYFRVGEVRECGEMLRVLVGDVKEWDRMYPKKHGQKNPFHEEIKQAARVIERGSDEFAALLDQWEETNIETLGLHTTRPASAVPVD